MLQSCIIKNTRVFNDSPLQNLSNELYLTLIIDIFMRISSKISLLFYTDSFRSYSEGIPNPIVIQIKKEDLGINNFYNAIGLVD